MLLVGLTREFVVGNTVSEMQASGNRKICLLTMNNSSVHSDQCALRSPRFNVLSVLMRAVQANLHDRGLRV